MTQRENDPDSVMKTALMFSSITGLFWWLILLLWCSWSLFPNITLWLTILKRST